VIVPRGLLKEDETVDDALEQEIQRLNQFFRLDRIDRTPLANPSSDAGYQIAAVSISVPTTSIPDDSAMNQMGREDPSVYQIIDVYVICNPECEYVTVEVFHGEDQSLTAQAHEIVASIRLNAPSTP